MEAVSGSFNGDAIVKEGKITGVVIHRRHSSGCDGRVSEEEVAPAGVHEAKCVVDQAAVEFPFLDPALKLRPGYTTNALLKLREEPASRQGVVYADPVHSSDLKSELLLFCAGQSCGIVAKCFFQKGGRLNEMAAVFQSKRLFI
jgi:hypothetical protein